MSEEENDAAFAFVRDPTKLNDLIQVNELLRINKMTTNKLVFVYSVPKVGSTSIVSSLRLYGTGKVSVIHIHDEQMLQLLCPACRASISELILFNRYLGKEVYVINVYRSPIERKISTFFEKIGTFHFNNTDTAVNGYSLSRVVTRFNNVFPWMAEGDHLLDKYFGSAAAAQALLPAHFDVERKHVLVLRHGVRYIGLRLKDSAEWGAILSPLFGFSLGIVKDYESTDKPIGALFATFRRDYRVPPNFLDALAADRCLHYYYSEAEREEYVACWRAKAADQPWTSYTSEQYALYETITLENAHLDFVQCNHYLDDGCTCKACSDKRRNIVTKLARRVPVDARVIHTTAKQEWIQKRLANLASVTPSRLPSSTKKNFKKDMALIVSPHLK